MTEKKKTSLQTPEDVAARQVEDRPPGASFGPSVEAPPSGFGAGSEGAGAEVWERVPDAPMPISSTKPRSLYEIAYPHPARGLDRDAARTRVASDPEAMPPHPMPVDRSRAIRRAAWGKKVWPYLGIFAAAAILPRLVGRRRSLAAAAILPRLWQAGRREAAPGGKQGLWGFRKRGALKRRPLLVVALGERAPNRRQLRELGRLIGARRLRRQPL